jgi:hypothetical protein
MQALQDIAHSTRLLPPVGNTLSATGLVLRVQALGLQVRSHVCTPAFWFLLPVSSAHERVYVRCCHEHVGPNVLGSTRD